MGLKKIDKPSDSNMNFILKNNLKYDEEKNKKIANSLTLLKLYEIVDNFQIFYEDGNIKHEIYKKDKPIIDKFIEYNPGYKMPKNLSKIVLRIEINKNKLFYKDITLKEIISKLKSHLKNSYIIYSSENIEGEIIMLRIILSESFIEKKIKNNLISIINKSQDLLNIIIRGIPGIVTAKYEKITTKFKLENGDLKEDIYYMINTVGSNYYEIFFISEIDHNYLQFDDINHYAVMYGIEAIREKISYEFKDIIGDKYNQKHFMLIADTMSRHGLLTNLEKTGLNKREKENILLRLGTSHTRPTLEESAINNKMCSTNGLTPSLMVGSSPHAFGTCYNPIYIDIDGVKEIIDDINKKK